MRTLTLVQKLYSDIDKRCIQSTLNRVIWIENEIS